MRAIVLGYHSIGCVGIEALIRDGFSIEAVFTHTDNPEENIWFPSVAECAASQKGYGLYSAQMKMPANLSQLHKL